MVNKNNNRDNVPVIVLLRLFRPFFVNKTPNFELFFLIFFYEKVEN